MPKVINQQEHSLHILLVRFYDMTLQAAMDHGPSSEPTGQIRTRDDDDDDDDS